MIKARMRVGAAWNDVCILDISPRGLAMQAAAPPPRGTYLEVRRGDHEILARVVWVNRHRFGVRTQDVLAIEQIVSRPDLSAPTPCADEPIAERRGSQRSAAERHEASRLLSRAMEFAFLSVFAASAAVVTFSAAAEALHRPLAKASAALAPR